MPKWRLFGCDPIDGDYYIGIISFPEIWRDTDVMDAINRLVPVVTINSGNLLSLANALVLSGDRQISIISKQDLSPFYRLYLEER